MSKKMDGKRVEHYELMVEAGQCFMYLLWSETVMRDLVVLQEGGEDMRRRYSMAFGKGPHPSDFARARLELGISDFGKVKQRFLDHWPIWNEHVEINDAIERIVLWRNALGHVNVQPFRNYHLYTPTSGSWNRMSNFMKCGICKKYYKVCGCPQDDRFEPPSLVIGNETIETIYADIRTVDLECFYSTAVSLNVEYMGVAWPRQDGGYEFRVHNVVDS